MKTNRNIRKPDIPPCASRNNNNIKNIIYNTPLLVNVLSSFVNNINDLAEASEEELNDIISRAMNATSDEMLYTELQKEIPRSLIQQSIDVTVEDGRADVLLNSSTINEEDICEEDTSALQEYIDSLNSAGITDSKQIMLLCGLFYKKIQEMRMEQKMALKRQSAEFQSIMQEVKDEYESKLEIARKIFEANEASLREKVKKLETKVKDLEKAMEVLEDRLVKQVFGLGKGHPRNYHYTVNVIEIAVLTVVFARGSFRSAEDVLKILASTVSEFKGIDIPDHTTIRQWVIKLGLDVYLHNDKLEELKKGYFIITDESITIGSQKLLVILALPTARKKTGPLKFSDLYIAFMSAAPSWKHEQVEAAIKKVEEKLGKKEPDYVLSDGGTNISLAVANLKIPHHKDISHAFGNMLKGVYEDAEDFKQWSKKVGDTRKFFLSDYGYLMPPSQQSKARFMNVLFKPANWSMKIIQNYHRFNRNERYMYYPILEELTLVEELVGLEDLFASIFKLVKQEGLNEDTVKRSLAMVKTRLSPCNERHMLILQKIRSYFAHELEVYRAVGGIGVHEISSDIIESMFGKFKNIAPCNKFFGITDYSLSLNMHTVLEEPENIKEIDVLARLNRTTINEVRHWKANNLCSSQYTKRRLAFAI